MSCFAKIDRARIVPNKVDFDIDDAPIDTSKVDGRCSACGRATVGGISRIGCGYSPIACDTCKARPCDQSC